MKLSNDVVRSQTNSEYKVSFNFESPDDFEILLTGLLTTEK